MKKAEMGRFNISPDEDSSSYSSNSDFNNYYPTKQAALKRWEKLCPFLKRLVRIGACSRPDSASVALIYCGVWRVVSCTVYGCLTAVTVSGVKGGSYLTPRH